MIRERLNLTKEKKMGMDVYGINPKIVGEQPKEPTNLYTGKEPKPTEEEVRAYYDQKEKFEEQNCGVYFRNNVWWWRPLASFIFEKIQFKDWFSDEHAEALATNGGMEWSEEQALEIAQIIEDAYTIGELDDREVQHKKKMKVAEDWNAKLEVEFQKLRDKHKDIAPIDYPPEDKKKWDELYESTDRYAHYPFSAENCMRFCKFLKECGGFKIC